MKARLFASTAAALIARSSPIRWWRPGERRHRRWHGCIAKQRWCLRRRRIWCRQQYMDRGSTAAPSTDRAKDEKAAPKQRTGQSPSRTDQRQGQSPRGGDQNQAQTPQQRDRAGQADRNAQGGRQGAKENTGVAPANVNVTGEQRTQIRQRLGSNTSARIDRSRVNFSLSVGVRVPKSVRLYSLPPEIVEIVPAYRRYKYVIVDEEIIIIDPRTYTIVTVIES